MRGGSGRRTTVIASPVESPADTTNMTVLPESLLQCQLLDHTTMASQTSWELLLYFNKLWEETVAGWVGKEAEKRPLFPC